MSPDNPQPDPRIDAYLDGTMSAAARAEFTRELDADRDLRSEVECRQRIEQALQRRFRPAAAPDDLIARLRAAQAAEPIVVRLRRSPLTGFAAAAAAVLVWGGLGWYFLAPLLDRQQALPSGPVDLAQQYKQCVEQGFQPTWVCKDDREFAATFRDRQGQGLMLAQMPDGTKMVGLTYYSGLTPHTTTMLARVDDAPVMVFVDSETANPQPVPPDGTSGLHLYRKELGSLILYELSPLDAPRVMDYLIPADVPPPS